MLYEVITIEETAASLEEMVATVQNSADHAGEADNLMKQTNRVVEQSAVSIDRLNRFMDDIAQSSQESAGVVKSINEIAFQTNLLALNASVEAARAGRAGAGFAVVATEVRNLALRASDAARNTSEIIHKNIEKIREGAEMSYNFV